MAAAAAAAIEAYKDTDEVPCNSVLAMPMVISALVGFKDTLDLKNIGTSDAHRVVVRLNYHLNHIVIWFGGLLGRSVENGIGDGVPYTTYGELKESIKFQLDQLTAPAPAAAAAAAEPQWKIDIDEVEDAMDAVREARTVEAACAAMEVLARRARSYEAEHEAKLSRCWGNHISVTWEYTPENAATAQWIFALPDASGRPVFLSDIVKRESARVFYTPATHVLKLAPKTPQMKAAITKFIDERATSSSRFAQILATGVYVPESPQPACAPVPAAAYGSGSKRSSTEAANDAAAEKNKKPKPNSA